MKLQNAEAPLEYVFFAQCLDHALGMILGSFVVMLGLATLSGPIPIDPLVASPYFWLGLVAILFLCTLGYRVFFSSLYGQTLGRAMVGTRPTETLGSSAFWRAHVFESLQVLFPLLWVLDLLLRFFGVKHPGPRYEFEYS
jgi:hypothetical protein